MSHEPSDFVAACKSYLDDRWQGVMRQFEEADSPSNPLAEYPQLIEQIAECLRSRIKTYHYVLPTQLLAKSVDQSLNVHAVQASYSEAGAFDARTVAHDVIVPFDRANHHVLGGSPEPYVNNPVRVPAITSDYRAQQKNKNDWDKLVAVLAIVQAENSPEFTHRVFEQVLFEIHKLLADVVVLYPTPSRISLAGVQQLVDNYLAVTSGGERLEAVCTALFQTIGKQFGIFDEVKREKVNAADSSSDMLADIECWKNGLIVLLVEVKDRSLTLTQFDSKIDLARSRQIVELLFLAQSGKDFADIESIDQRVVSEFTSGQNVYISNFSDFSLGILILLGEKGRYDFVNAIGSELDRVNAGISHRRAWAQLLKSV